MHGAPRYLFPVQVMAELFRGLFLDGLRKLLDQGILRSDGQDVPALTHPAVRIDWVIR